MANADNNGVPVVWPVSPMTAYVPDAVDLVDPDVAAAANAVLQPPDGKVLNPPKGAATN